MQNSHNMAKKPSLSNTLHNIFWKINRFLYKYLYSPILSILSVDRAHHMMAVINSFVGRFSITRNIISFFFNKRPTDLLRQDFFGIKFNNPIGTPAGYDKNGKVVQMISSIGFGFCTVGSVTEKQCNGNKKPWLYKLPKARSYVVNAGLCNDGSAAVIKRLKKYSKKSINNLPIVLSVAKTNCCEVVDVDTGIADYIATIKTSMGVSTIKIIELNISCPNTFGGEPFTTPERLGKLLSAVDDIKINRPIFIKMPVDLPWQEFSKLLDIAVEHKVSGVTIANLTKDREKAKAQDHLPETVRGNFSGKLTWDLSNQLIRNTYQNYGKKLIIIGVGGIQSAEDAYTKIKLGASLVEILTGMMLLGPQLASEINNDLEKLLQADGFNHISEAIGIEAKKE